MVEEVNKNIENDKVKKRNDNGNKRNKVRVRI
jgi:hypothetical protein